MIKNTVIYTVTILNPLAFFEISFNLLFFYLFSILLQGINNIYAIIIPAKNGLIILKNFPIASIIFVKLSKALYTTIIATPKTNQYSHLLQ